MSYSLQLFQSVHFWWNLHFEIVNTWHCCTGALLRSLSEKTMIWVVTKVRF
ncbi:hypothetical protein SLEP1_g58496 [Rubroshorea leprosula]|uniref:Uncharacterized protein n=1 Tax=Rubroshorea leprosula TaxID=152421 RepID=A0AAV5MQH7_9ROSI|nr:hypothetical protein SLEP1_g58496 [Rubroshorea leprosula]